MVPMSAMTKTAAAPLPLDLDRASPEPLARQLYDQLRELILSGRLAGGTRLPSTRALAAELGISRNTSVAAFDQLFAEGYVEGTVGAGTFVSTELPDQLPASGHPPQPLVEAGALSGPSRRGRMLAGLAPPRARRHRAFAVGVPELGEFPFELWSRLLGQSWRRPDMTAQVPGDAAGLPGLRAAIARYLATARAVVCDPEQVIVTSGVQQGIGLACQVLLDPGDKVWVEDPGYPGVHGALAGAGMKLAPVPVDAEGLDVAAGEAGASDARLACVTPSHHYPLGTVMSLPRRLALIEWAARRDGWILEDDYDSEFRYRGRPLASLQGLDRGGRVIYAGSFSKVMFPSLRLGYLVVPPHLVDVFRAVRSALDDHASLIAQPALARFIDDGHFAAHIRRMRRLYAGRQEALLEAGRHHLGGLLDLAPDDAGLHLVGRLTPATGARMDDREAARRGGDAGVATVALSTYRIRAPQPPALVLGYAAVAEAEIEAAAAALARALAP